MATDLLAPSERPVAAAPSSSAIPLLDLKAQYAGIQKETIDAVHRVLASQHFILGADLEAFEAEFAEYVGAKFAVGCGSGSDALLLTMMALGIEPDDEVITTPFTFGATAGSIARLRARPVFVDIHPQTFNLDEEQLEAAITRRTRAIMPVHLFGLPSNMGLILEIAQSHNLAVIEDAAQAIGSTWHAQGVGTVGTFGCFSFFPSKNLGGAGDGGMITTNDAQLALALRRLRAHGTQRKYHYEVIGINSRLDALQAAILRVKLRHLNDWTAGRRRNAERYRELFAEYGLLQRISPPWPGNDCVHVYNQYTIRAPHRDELLDFLRARGISTEIYYPGPLHLEPAFSYLGYSVGAFPQAEVASHEVLSLPIYPELTAEKQRVVVAAVASFYLRTEADSNQL
ncbi:MAG: DegT/DnrJ/EryC1/StrS family aminotransferase [Candidatus Sulfotelmatobacter sp.]